VFDDAEKALKYIDDTPHTLVVKASGLAAGKGVIVPKNKDEAKQAVREIMVPHSATPRRKDVDNTKWWHFGRSTKCLARPAIRWCWRSCSSDPRSLFSAFAMVRAVRVLCVPRVEPA
jgi:hypothetical protein